MKNVKTISVAFGNLGPAEAQQMLDEFPYDRQRDLNMNTVISYAEQMKAGEWSPGLDIEVAFAVAADGVMHGFLLNGRHRLNAVILSDTIQEFTIRHVAAESMEHVAWRYGVIDIQKRRSMRDTSKALQLAEAFDLTQRNTNCLLAAVPFMLNGFKRGSHYLLSSRGRVEAATEFAGTMARVGEYLIEGIPTLAEQTRRLGPLGVALVTTADAMPVYGEVTVAEFWKGVVADDGLHNDDPRKVVVRALYDTKHGDGAQRRDSNERIARVCAAAWNAWVQHKPLKRAIVQDINSDILILGTRFKGKGVKDGEKANQPSRSDEPARGDSVINNGAGEVAVAVDLDRQGHPNARNAKRRNG